jgi:hypothetical protein
MGGEREPAAKDHLAAGEGRSTAGGEREPAAKDHLAAGEEHSTTGDDREPTIARPDTGGDEYATTHQDRVRAGQDYVSAGGSRVNAGGDRANAGGEHAGRLERRSRLLLHAYPAAYRRERGDEIIGTLLDATPEGQAWPRLRDARALALGGLRARAAQNRRRSTAANLRVAVMAGVSMYVLVMAADYLGTWVIDPGPLRYEWRIMVLGLFIIAAVLPAWLAPRTIATLLALAAAVPIYLLGRQEVPIWTLISLMVYVAAIVLLVPRSARPPRAWLWLIGALAVAVQASAYSGSAGLVPQLAPPLALGVVSVAWIAIDARLAVAAAACVLTFEVARMMPFFNAALLPYVLAIVAIAALPVWLTRRQSAPRARPR